MRVKHLDDLGEVRERTGQAVDLVDDDGVDPMRGDVGQKTLERRALHSSAGITGVIIELRQDDPALMPLTSNERLAGFALRVEGVELLFEPFLRRFAGIDGAADPPTADGNRGRVPSRLARRTTSRPSRLGLRLNRRRAPLTRLTHRTPPRIVTG